MLNKTYRYLIDSPTIMTWFSFGSKPISFLLLLPLILTKFSKPEIALWYLFSTFISFQILADFGFYNTFVRIISYSLSGGCNSVQDLVNLESKSRKIDKPNLTLTGDIIGTMKYVYGWLTLIAIIVLICCSPLLSRSINLTNKIEEGWFAWIFIIIGSTFNFAGRKFTNFLLGQNKVALVRKWEGVFSVAALVSNIVVVYWFQSLVLLVFTNQIWLVIGFFRNRYLANNNKYLSYSYFKSYKFNKEIFKITWPLAWKSGFSSFSSEGTSYISGIFYAQYGNAEQIAIYLFALRIMTIIRSFALAPFYSKIPLLSSLRGKNNVKMWEITAQRSMLIASFVMVVGIIGFGILGNYYFVAIKSSIKFPDKVLWLSLGFAFMLHRYGAMHTQLYTTLNKVNSHISDFISSIIMFAFWFIFHEKFAILVFPYGMIVSYLSFYVWYSAYFSYKHINMSVLKFEYKANLFPFILFFLYILFLLY